MFLVCNKHRKKFPKGGLSIIDKFDTFENTLYLKALSSLLSLIYRLRLAKFQAKCILL